MTAILRSERLEILKICFKGMEKIINGKLSELEKIKKLLFLVELMVQFDDELLQDSE